MLAFIALAAVLWLAASLPVGLLVGRAMRWANG